MKNFCSHENMFSFFKAVCDPNRQAILYLIKKNGEINASDIIKHFTLSQPTISHHLKILVASGVIISKKSGKETRYKINEELINNCCFGFAGIFKKSKENNTH
jgi:ArsR family transcriptional regulator